MNSEVYALAAMTVCGGVVVMLFDMFRVLRHILKSGKVVTAIEDAIFWILAVYIVWQCLWIFNNGEIRIFEAAGFCIGAILYILLLQKVIFKVFTIIFENILKIIHLILRFLLTPLHFLYKILLVPLYKKMKKQ